MAFRKSASKDRQSRLPVSLRSVVDKQSPLAIINSLHWTVAKGQPVPSPAYRSGGILGSMLDKFYVAIIRNDMKDFREAENSPLI